MEGVRPCRPRTMSLYQRVLRKGKHLPVFFRGETKKHCWSLLPGIYARGCTNIPHGSWMDGGGGVNV